MITKLKYLLKRYLTIYRMRKYRQNIPDMLKEVRKKKIIRVAFVLQNLPMWKTENLYIKLKSHPRFDVILCPGICLEGNYHIIKNRYEQLISYFNKKGFEYLEIDNINKAKADIVFYDRPYEGAYLDDLWIYYNKSLISYTAYAFNNVNSAKSFNHPLVNRSAFFFIENQLVKKSLSKILDSRGCNLTITGVPMADRLLSDKHQFNDPWKPQEKTKKRIIWAPHFTYRDFTWLNFGSFLSLYKIMPILAEKYKNEIQIAFKPHPLLYGKLVEEWGEEKTDAYYLLWDKMENTQKEDGEYVGLFKHSDAMIHDSGSFLMEYIYMNKPVLYTLRDQNALSQLNDFGRMAYEQCYHGNTPEIVEQFIVNVINDRDEMKASREQFFNAYLLPPNGKSACENIIDAILGINNYN